MKYRVHFYFNVDGYAEVDVADEKMAREYPLWMPKMIPSDMNKNGKIYVEVYGFDVVEVEKVEER